jgi:hypothetical protein
MLWSGHCHEQKRNSIPDLYHSVLVWCFGHLQSAGHVVLEVTRRKNTHYNEKDESHPDLLIRSASHFFFLSKNLGVIMKKVIAGVVLLFCVAVFMPQPPAHSATLSSCSVLRNDWHRAFEDAKRGNENAMSRDFQRVGSDLSDLGLRRDGAVFTAVGKVLHYDELGYYTTAQENKVVREFKSAIPKIHRDVRSACPSITFT